MKLLYGLSAFALAMAVSSHAYATNFCQERTVDGGTELVDGGTEVHDVFGEVNKIVGSTAPGPDGWDGIGGQCKKPGSDRIWVGPRNAKGECLTPASLVGSQGGAIFKKVIEKIGEETIELPDYEVELPDIEEYREYGWNQTGYFPWQGYFGWSDWSPGDC